MPGSSDKKGDATATPDEGGLGAEATREMPMPRMGPQRKVVVPTLRVAAGRDMLRFVTFSPGEVVVIGRDDGAGLILADSSVSRRHAKVECASDGTLLVQDLASTNGTAVNGQAIDKSVLRPGDHLEVGAVSLRLDLLSMEEVGHLATVVARLESHTRDPLTGLLTRVWMDEDLAELLDRATRRRIPLCALFLDLDHFKAVNDTYGHGVGDDVLVAVARLVMVNVRDGDPCVRYGGEEIVVILEDARVPTGMDVAERIRRAVADHAWSRTAPGLEVTASIGVAEWVHAEPRRDWLHRADQALYTAKGTGRNRVVRADPPAAP